MSIAEEYAEIEKYNLKIGMNNFYAKEKLHDLLYFIKNPSDELDINEVCNELADIIAILEAPTWKTPKTSKYHRTRKKQSKKSTTK